MARTRAVSVTGRKMALSATFEVRIGPAAAVAAVAAAAGLGPDVAARQRSDEAFYSGLAGEAAARARQSREVPARMLGGVGRRRDGRHQVVPGTRIVVR